MNERNRRGAVEDTTCHKVTGRLDRVLSSSFPVDRLEDLAEGTFANGLLTRGPSYTIAWVIAAQCLWVFFVYIPYVRFHEGAFGPFHLRRCKWFGSIGWVGHAAGCKLHLFFIWLI